MNKRDTHEKRIAKGYCRDRAMNDAFPQFLKTR
jgi:hypothetical protein